MSSKKTAQRYKTTALLNKVFVEKILKKTGIKGLALEHDIRLTVLSKAYLLAHICEEFDVARTFDDHKGKQKDKKALKIFEEFMDSRMQAIQFTVDVD